MSSLIVIISDLKVIFRNDCLTLPHVSKYTHHTHCLKYCSETLCIIAIIKDLRFCSGSVEAGHSASCPIDWRWLT